MNHVKTEKLISLKVLVIYCSPEDGAYLAPEKLELPEAVEQVDVALSFSANSKGWGRNISKNFRVYCDIDQDHLLLKLKSYDLFLLFPLSLNTLAKFALGIRDSFPTKLLGKAIELNKPILLFEDGIPKQDTPINPHFLRIYRKYWEDIIGSNIKGFNLDNLSETIARIIRGKQNHNRSILESNSRQFLTREDVLIAADSLEPIKVPHNAIITDVAKETASELGIQIIRE